MQKLCCVCTIQQPLPVWIIVTSLPTHFSINSHPFLVGIVSQIMDIRQTLRYLGAPIGAKSFLFGDNRSVVTSATLAHSTLTKRHNILASHRAREAIAAKLMAFYWIQSAYNLSDMHSKHWDHPTVYPMILKLLITRGNITLGVIHKRSNPRSGKRKFKITTRKIEKERKRRIKIRKKND